MSKILVLYYSAWGHVEKMAEAVAEGARAVPGTEVTVKRVPELVPEEVAKKSGMKLDQPAPICSVDEGSTRRQGRQRVRQHGHPAWRPGNDHHLVP